MTEPSKASKEAPEKQYQSYTCSRKSTKVITTKGRLLRFVHSQYVTDSKEEIEYLDHEISIGGLRGITKGKPVASAHADPMAALKRKHIAEYLAAEAQVPDSSTDMGTTEKTPVKPAGTDKLAAAKASVAAASNSK